MTKAHAKAGLSRADLLWSFAVVDKAQYVEIAELLGFEERPEKQAAENNLSMDIVATFPTLSAKIELSTEVTKLPIQAPQQSPSYCRITARQRGPDAEQEEPVDTRHE